MNWDRFFSQTSRALAAKVKEAVSLPSSKAARLPSTGLKGDTTGAEQSDGAEAERYYLKSGNLLWGYDKANDQFIGDK